MNGKNFISWVLGLGLLAGCVQQRYSTPPPYSRNVVAPLPDVKPPPTAADYLVIGAAQSVAPFGGEGWRDLFDGQTFSGWKQTPFAQGGAVVVTNGLMVFERGNPFVGVNGTNAFPKVNYELAFDAMRVAGDDFFCGLTFPVREAFCSLIVGGWGGGVAGLSNVDGVDASENETNQYISFERGRWYRIRLRVTEQRIEAWIEQKKVVDLLTVGRQLEVRFGEILASRPFGICSWNTTAAFRAIKVRSINVPAGETL